MEDLKNMLNYYQAFLKEYNLRIKGIDKIGYQKNLALISNINKAITKKLNDKSFLSQQELNYYKEYEDIFFTRMQESIKLKFQEEFEVILRNESISNKIVDDSEIFFSIMCAISFYNKTNSNQIDMKKYLSDVI